MTKHLGDLGEMAVELLAMRVGVITELQHGLDKVLEKIEETAKGEFGEYQPNVGPFPAWAELAEATKADRAHQGFPENEPLLRTGDLQDSIEHERDGFEGVVGSKADIMLYHELGTANMPARPVLGPAAYRNKPAIEKLLCAAVVAGMIGGTEAKALLAGSFD